MKYGNRKTIVDGITFDSMKEARRYGELKMLERAGKVVDLQLQPEFILTANNIPLTYDSGRKIKYRADFQYLCTTRVKRIVEDVKGYKTTDYKIKKAIMKSMGIEVVET